MNSKTEIQNSHDSAKKPARDKVLLQKTRVPGLRLYTPTGTFYAYFKCQGRPLKRSLETKVRSVAELRLRDLKRKLSGVAPAGQQRKVLSVAEAIEKYRSVFTTAANTKISSKHYRDQTIKALLKRWPGIEAIDIRKISSQECREWSVGLGAAYSASRFNNTISTLKAILQIAVDEGYRHDNPAAGIKRRRITDKPLQLPDNETFKEFLSIMRQAGGRMSRDCADFAALLAFSGSRLSEGRRLCWGDVNFDTDELTIKGDPETGTKNWSVRTIPMNESLKALLLQMSERRGLSPDPSERICRVGECQKAMDRAAKRAGIPRLTHHNPSDFFATVCIDSAVPLKALLNNLHERLDHYCRMVGRRCELWHGDVGPAQRNRIKSEPPDILLTTPESGDRRADAAAIAAGVGCAGNPGAHGASTTQGPRRSGLRFCGAGGGGDCPFAGVTPPAPGGPQSLSGFVECHDASSECGLSSGGHGDRGGHSRAGWAAMDQRFEDIAATAVEEIFAMWARNENGLPVRPKDSLLDGTKVRGVMEG